MSIRKVFDQVLEAVARMNLSMFLCLSEEVIVVDEGVSADEPVPFGSAGATEEGNLIITAISQVNPSVNIKTRT